MMHVYWPAAGLAMYSVMALATAAPPATASDPPSQKSRWTSTTTSARGPPLPARSPSAGTRCSSDIPEDYDLPRRCEILCQPFCLTIVIQERAARDRFRKIRGYATGVTRSGRVGAAKGRGDQAGRKHAKGPLLGSEALDSCRAS